MLFWQRKTCLSLICEVSKLYLTAGDDKCVCFLAAPANSASASSTQDGAPKR